MEKYHYTLKYPTKNNKSLNSLLDIFDIDPKLVIPKKSIILKIGINRYFLNFNGSVEVKCSIHYYTIIKKEKVYCCYSFDKLFETKNFNSIIRKIKLNNLAI